MTLTLRHLKLPQLSLLCAGVALALYCFTLAPTFGWGDSADLAMRMVYSGDKTFLGSHRDYVLYRAVGGLFQHLPFGDVGTRANFMTAFFGAVSVGLVAMLTGLVTRSNLAAMAAGLAFTVSHTFWLMSVVAEVYSFNAALVLLALALTTLWWQRGDARFLYGAAAFTGLALFHHASGLVLGACIAPLVLARLRTLGIPRLLLVALIAVIASLPHWLHAIALLQAGHSLATASGLVAPANPFYAAAPLRELAKFLAYICYNFMGLALPLMALGILQAIRHRTWELLPAALWALAFLYAGVTSTIPDKFNIYVLIYPVLAIAVGIGVAVLEPRFFTRKHIAMGLLTALLLIPPIGYVAAIKTSAAFRIDLVGARVIPYRNNSWYFMWPGKRGDWGPRHFAEESLNTLPHGAVLIADYSLWRPLYALQATENLRPDVTLVWSEPLTWNGSTIADYITKQPCRTPVYLAYDAPAEYYQLAELRAAFRLEKKGFTQHVVRKCNGSKHLPQ